MMGRKRRQGERERERLFGVLYLEGMFINISEVDFVGMDRVCKSVVT